jgi:hypothetical protein
MDMELIPIVYKCPTHDRDLTDEVRRKVQALPTPTTGFGWRRARASGRPEEPFEVDVNCPDGNGHNIDFYGSFRPA